VNALPSYFPPSPAPLPRNLEVEQGLLGALLDNSDVWTVVSASLQPEHFSEPLHARIYAAIVEMASHQGLVSPFVLKTKLESDPAFKDVGGFAYISGLIANALPRVTLESHSSLIRELADRRAVIASCETAMAEASDTGSGEFRRTISRHLDSLTSVLDGARERKTCFTLAEASANAIARLNRLRSGEPDFNAIPTGLKSLDTATGGLRRENMRSSVPVHSASEV
jgi:replicative DNA helicase